MLTRRYKYKSIRHVKQKLVEVYFRPLFGSGVSLGDYIILDYQYCGKACSRQMVAHEYGHSKQSLILGWLYLPLVGLPSIVGNIWHRLFHKNWSDDQKEKWYYSRYPENWADKLGDVTRD
jgi:hypothetical protein